MFFFFLYVCVCVYYFISDFQNAELVLGTIGSSDGAIFLLGIEFAPSECGVARLNPHYQIFKDVGKNSKAAETAAAKYALKSA